MPAERGEFMVDFVLGIFQNVIAMVPYDWYKTKFAAR